jgi:hypothetical protein
MKVIFIKTKFTLMMFVLVFSCLFANSIFADDVGIIDIITYDTIEMYSNFDVNVVVVNNSGANKDVNLNVDILSPTGFGVGNAKKDEIIFANSTQLVTVPFIWDANIDTNASINSHIINVELGNDYIEGSIKNNFLRKYFIIIGKEKKIPVPDFPLILSILLVFTIVLIYSKPENKPKIKK